MNSDEYLDLLQGQVFQTDDGQRKWPEERIEIGLEPLPGFNLRAQVVGHGGSYVKHIQQETRCRVQIKGRGSGFIEQNTNAESDEPMYLHVAYVYLISICAPANHPSGPDPAEVQRAKEMCIDLLGTVKEQYQKHKDNPPQRGYGQGYGQGGDRQNSYGGYGGGYGGYGNSTPGGSVQSPTTPGPTAAPGAASPSQDYTAQYAAYYAANPSADPYAAYGGYAAYVQMYQYYAAQQAVGGAPGAGSTPSNGDAAPPPPPPSSSPPGANGSYNSVGDVLLFWPQS
jgi:hypothetical protein